MWYECNMIYLDCSIMLSSLYISDLQYCLDKYFKNHTSHIRIWLPECIVLAASLRTLFLAAYYFVSGTSSHNMTVCLSYCFSIFLICRQTLPFNEVPDLIGVKLPVFGLSDLTIENIMDWLKLFPFLFSLIINIHPCHTFYKALLYRKCS